MKSDLASVCGGTPVTRVPGPHCSRPPWSHTSVSVGPLVAKADVAIVVVQECEGSSSSASHEDVSDEL